MDPGNDVGNLEVAGGLYGNMLLEGTNVTVGGNIDATALPGATLTVNADEDIALNTDTKDHTISFGEMDINAGDEIRIFGDVQSTFGSVDIKSDDGSIYLYQDTIAFMNIILEAGNDYDDIIYSGGNIHAFNDVTLKSPTVMGDIESEDGIADRYEHYIWAGAGAPGSVGKLTAESWIQAKDKGDNLYLWAHNPEGLAIDLQHWGDGVRYGFPGYGGYSDDPSDYAASTNGGNLEIRTIQQGDEGKIPGAGDIQISGDLSTNTGEPGWVDDDGPGDVIIARQEFEFDDEGDYYPDEGDFIIGKRDPRGGVLVWTGDGKIYTQACEQDDALQIGIYGYSDEYFGYGVMLPYTTDDAEGDTKAAIILISSDDLIMGEKTRLHADGAYYGGIDFDGEGEFGLSDNRPGSDLLEEVDTIGGFSRDPGIPIDTAVYVQSTENNVIYRYCDEDFGNPIQVGPAWYIPGNINGGLYGDGYMVKMVDDLYPYPYPLEFDGDATVVLDAWDSVLIEAVEECTGCMADYAGDVNYRLEVVSRITEWLNEAIDEGRLPFADDPAVMVDLLDGNDYVMRGAGQDNPDIVDENAEHQPYGRAWVLELEPALVAAPLYTAEAEPAEESAVETGLNCTDAMNWLANEVGTESIEQSLAFAYIGSTDVRPCEVADTMYESAQTLADPTGDYMMALSDAVSGQIDTDAPLTDEQMTNISQTIAMNVEANPAYASASDWLNAMDTYVSLLVNELGFSAEDAVALAMGKYAPSEAENAQVAQYLQVRASEAAVK
jgi:hypothetical protein